MLNSGDGWQVGGGPTGVELAAEIHDLVVEDLIPMFPHFKVRALDEILLVMYTSMVEEREQKLTIASSRSQ